MSQIDGTRLRMQRKANRLTQEGLAEASKIDLQTISRIERGVSKASRQHTVERLAAALKIDASQLLPVDTNTDGASDPSIGVASSQLNRRLTHDKRNAFSLVARRYDVSAQQILELAPLMFAILAEQSLAGRRAALEKAQSAMCESEDKFSTIEHLEQRFGSLFFALENEERSIAKRDLFAQKIDSDIMPFDYQYDVQAPFVRFLSNCVAATNGVSDFHWAHCTSSPYYALDTAEALDFTGGDEPLAEAIVSGEIALHDMDRALFDDARLADRVNWMRVQRQADAERRSNALGDLVGFDLLAQWEKDQ